MATQTLERTPDEFGSKDFWRHAERQLSELESQGTGTERIRQVGGLATTPDVLGRAGRAIDTGHIVFQRGFPEFIP
jgi:hypothetical protein